MKNNDTFLLEKSYEKVLNEKFKNIPLICIDIQPIYNEHCKKIMSNFALFLNEYQGDIICYFNLKDETYTNDTRYDNVENIKEYYRKNGIKDEIISKIIFKDKQYGFFSGWMDEYSVSGNRKNIIKAIRYMVLNKLKSSKEISKEEWIKNVFKDNNEYIRNMLQRELKIPNISISELKALDGCFLCGGHYTRCLREFELLLSAFNIKYTEIKKLLW